VNAPLVSLQSKNLNNAKSEIRFKQLIRSVIRGAFTIDSSTPTTGYFTSDSESDGIENATYNIPGVMEVHVINVTTNRSR
jgi:hypothetical protein